MTLTLNDRLKEFAINLNDGRLLARLSGGNIVAQEFKHIKYRLVMPDSTFQQRKSTSFSHQETQPGTVKR